MLYERRATVAAGSDFAGSEFGADPTRTVQVHEVLIGMGVESKTWSIAKRWTGGEAILAQSVDGNGDPGAAADSSVVFMPDTPLYLTSGQYIAIVTSSASNELDASIMYSYADEEV